MKKTVKLIIYIFMLFVATVSCKTNNVEHYELIGGNPKIDYIDFLNDSVCRFVVPGPLEMTTKYLYKDNIYTISIQGIVTAKLLRVDNKTLKGNAPFFDGIWQKK